MKNDNQYWFNQAMQETDKIKFELERLDHKFTIFLGIMYITFIFVTGVILSLTVTS